MAEITLDRTIHAGGKVFFKGKAFVSDADKILIDAELERLKQIEAEQAESEEETETPKKKTKSTEK